MNVFNNQSTTISFFIGNMQKMRKRVDNESMD